MQSNIAHYFLLSCQKFPNQPAIIIDEKIYTYHELFAYTKSIYVFLEKQHIQNERIGIFCQNDIWTVAAILAVVAYGAAYVPLNENFPNERNAFIVKDCDLSIILSSENIKIDLLNVEMHDISNLTIDFKEKSYFLTPKIEQKTAYILYTSGSTGVPKGVPVSIVSVFQLFKFLQQQYDFNENDSFLQCFEWTFDMSVLALFSAFLNGSSCYLLPKKGIKWVNILKYTQQYPITVLALVPSVISLSKKYLPSLSFPKVRYCLFSGEALLHSHAKIWAKALPNAKVENLYGLTESAVVISYYLFDEKKSESESFNNVVPIGHFFPEVEILVLNEKDENAAINEIGELCLAGKQLIDTYINGVHAARFFEQKNHGESKLFYRSGDLVKKNENGNYLYVGRNDEQVQVQGYRVELREIEQVLAEITQTNVAVITKSNNENQTILYAFVEKNPFTEKEILAQLSEKLNFYMIPKRIIELEILPLSLNGKIDKKKLKKEIKKWT